MRTKEALPLVVKFWFCVLRMIRSLSPSRHNLLYAFYTLLFPILTD